MSLPEINLVGKISHFFALSRPLSILLLIISVVIGLVSFFLTPKQYNPEIIRPAFAVSIAYEGATISGVVDHIVYELVERINTIKGVDDVFTTVRDGAVINTTVIFEVGYDSVKAKLDLLSQLDQYSYLARGNISQLQILEINPETIPVLQVVFGSEILSISELRQKVVSLSHKIGSVEGLSDVQVLGGYESSLVVEVDLQKLSDNNISFENIIRTLQESQMRIVSSGVRNQFYVTEVVFDSVVSDLVGVGDLIIQNGVRVRDVARVYEGAGSDRSYVIFKDKKNSGEVLMLAMSKIEGYSAPDVTGDLLSELNKNLSKAEFSDLEYRVVGDDGATAEAAIFGLTKNLITSIVIVALILLLFLSVRAAAVVLVAIPTTLLIVFGLGLLFDQTINRITLFALILSLGLLVDSAIVAVENIYSHLRRWKVESFRKTRELVIASALDEVGVGLLLSTVTSVIVFLPLNFIGGMMGPYMSPIAFFVPVTLVVSFFVAIIVTPFVANVLLHTEEKTNKLNRVFSRMMLHTTDKYVSLLRSILFSVKKQKLILQSAVVIFIISLTLPLLGLVHFQMLPRADRDQFYVYVDLDVDTDREETRKVSESLSEVLIEDVDVVSIQQFVSTPPILDFNGMFKGAQNRSGSYQATLRINLSPSDDRGRMSNSIVNDLRQVVLDYDSNLSTKIRFIEEPPGPPVQATLVAKIITDDKLIRREIAGRLQEVISKIEGVVDLDTSAEEVVGRVKYSFDYVAANNLGVSPNQVSVLMEVLKGSYEVSEFYGSENSEYSPLIIKIQASQLSSPNFINNVTLQTDSDKSVSLQSVLSIDYEPRPTTVYLEGAESLTYLTAEVQGRSIIYVTIEAIKLLLEDGVGDYFVSDWDLWGMDLVSVDNDNVRLEWGGEWKMTLENFRDLGIAMGAALLMVYALLVAQYNTFTTPFYILVTVPLGLVGILWGFLFLDNISNTYLTATALIGFIALIGLVVNNAIIFLEYVGQAEAKGLEYREALISAGEARLRPILLTSLTTVLGSLTIANDPVWSGLAWAIIFGLSLSTVLTLVIYPTLLVYFRSEKK